MVEWMEPFLDIAIHPLLKILLIGWLSLPKFKGALLIYDKVLFPHLIQRYELERKVDDTMSGMTEELKRQVWAFVVGNTSFAFYRGLIFFQSHLMITSTDDEDGQHEENKNNDSVSESNSGSESDDDSVGVERSNQDVEIHHGNRMQQPSSQQHYQRQLTSTSPSSLTKTTQKRQSNTSLNPHHSVSTSGISSLNEYDSDSDGEEEYVNDFIQMLTRGLYVFCSIDFLHPTNAQNITNNSNKNKDETTEKKTLKIFSYNDDKKKFTLSAVPSSTMATINEENEDIVYNIPVHLIDKIISHSTTMQTQEQSPSISIVLFLDENNNDDDSSFNSQDSENTSNNDKNIIQSVDIVLSKLDDRDILLEGLNVCLPYLQTLTRL